MIRLAICCGIYEKHLWDNIEGNLLKCKRCGELMYIDYSDYKEHGVEELWSKQQ